MDDPDTLQTRRLTLRRFREDDLDAFYELGRDPLVVRYVGVTPLASRAEALEVLRTRPLADYRAHGFGRLACVLRETGELIGMAGLKKLVETDEIDLAYWLRPPFWGRRLATEAALAVLARGLGPMGIERVVAYVHPENHASQRLVVKLGMTPLGVAPHFDRDALKFAIERGALREQRPPAEPDT